MKTDKEEELFWTFFGRTPIYFHYEEEARRHSCELIGEELYDTTAFVPISEVLE